MNLIRRSISFPEDVYEALRLEAFSRRVSVNQLIIEPLLQKEKIRPNKRKLSAEEQLRRDFALFDKIAATSVRYDATRAVREERDRDEA